MTGVAKLTLKEMTAHIRKRVKVAGIEARVRMDPSQSFGALGVQVISPSFDRKFTNEESRMIAHICECSGLTEVRGEKIDVDLYGQLAKEQYNFFMPRA